MENTLKKKKFIKRQLTNNSISKSKRTTLIKAIARDGRERWNNCCKNNNNK